jgi:hypothetical protein
MSRQYDAYEGSAADDDVTDYSVLELVDKIEEREKLEEDTILDEYEQELTEVLKPLKDTHVEKNNKTYRGYNEWLNPNPCPATVTDPEMRAIIDGLEERKALIRKNMKIKNSLTFFKTSNNKTNEDKTKLKVEHSKKPEI